MNNKYTISERNRFSMSFVCMRLLHSISIAMNKNKQNKINNNTKWKNEKIRVKIDEEVYFVVVFDYVV